MKSTGASALSRRSFVAATSAGVAGLATRSRAQGPIGYGPPGRTRPSPYSLVERLTYGLNSEEVSQFRAMGHNGYLEYQLSPGDIYDGPCESVLTQFQSLGLTPYQCLKLPDDVDYAWENLQSLVLRPIHTKRQLLEVMTEFWLDHFNIYIYNTIGETIPAHVANIRKYALGSFETLLKTVVKSVAIMGYLDQLGSVNGYTNQNFSRELMELHTLGVGGGYTETDVQRVAEFFTGWSMEEYFNWPWDATSNANFGKFKFYANYHKSTSGYFLGSGASNFIPAGGVEQGEAILTTLANHPNTARHICTKLLQKFVTYTPSPALVDAAVQKWTDTKGNIAKVLRYILDESRFQVNFQRRLKRPNHLVYSGLRATKAVITDADSLIWELLYPMGHVPLFWPAPNGYPDAFDAWVANERPRWYFANQLVVNWLWNARCDVLPLCKTREPGQIASAIDFQLTGGRMTDAHRAKLREYMGTNPSNATIREAWGLGLAGPEFQVY